MTMGCDVREHDVILFLVFFVAQMEQVSPAHFTMLSQDQSYVLNAGDDVDMECEYYIEHFNLFDNPVQWKKVQYHEESELNIMGNIKPPFDQSERFWVSFNPLPPRYTLGMRITNLSLEDSGNYTCEIRGPRSALLGKVTHKIFVRAPVRDVIITHDNISQILGDTQTEKTLKFIEGDGRALRCVAEGGNPPPDVQITIGRRDFTEEFRRETVPRLSGPKGFRTMHTTTVLWTDNFQAFHNDDGRKLKCRVEVSGLGVKTQSARIQVNYAPTMDCTSATAYIDDKNVNLECVVRSRPRVTTLFWVTDGNGTTVSEGEVINEFWTLVMDRSDDAIETKLYLRVARADRFRKYTLVAENEVAVKTQDVELYRKYKSQPKSPSASSGHQSQSSSSGGSTRNGYLFLPSGTARHTAPTYFITAPISVLLVIWISLRV